MNLIAQFPVFMQSYIQKQMIIYPVETVPVSAIGLNQQGHCYTKLHIIHPYSALNEETYISLINEELRNCMNFLWKTFVVKFKSKFSGENVLQYES